jgi:pyridoxal biosynthesis lyase PdxS
MRELAHRLRNLADATDILREKGPVKAGDKSAAVAALDAVMQEIESNIPWIQQTTKENCEKTVSRAKNEVDAMVMHVQNTLGRKALETLKEEEFKELEEGK